MERDGHFQLNRSKDEALVSLQAELSHNERSRAAAKGKEANQLRPDTDTGVHTSVDIVQPKCNRCPELSEHALSALEKLSRAESLDHAAEHLTTLVQATSPTGAPKTNISSSLLENKSVDWRALTALAAHSLAQHESWLGREYSPGGGGTTTVPTIPPQRFQSKPKGWTERAYDKYVWATEKLAPLRGGVGNVAATVLSAILGPESCILKILYVFYVHDGEDDYPYVPRGCGDYFDFAMFSYSIKVPWILITGTILAVMSWSSNI